MNEHSPVREIKGIGEKTEKLFQKMGVYTAGDLLRYYPRTYDIYEAPVPVSELEEGTVAAVEGCVFGSVQVSPNRKLQTVSALIRDLTGTLKVLWFRMPFLRNTLRSGSRIIVRGRVVNKRGGLVMEHPEIFQPVEKYQEKLNTMQPVYPLTAGLSNLTVMKAVREALEHIHLQRETIPESIRQRYHLCEYNYALRGIHFPADKTMYMYARKRLVFEEFLEFLLAIRQMKEEKEMSVNGCRMEKKQEVDDFLSQLPFELTNAQKKVWKEIRKDMQGDYTMSRLVQGDVGSGKTIVAVLALLEAACNGYQGAMMAPTEVLARQHYQSICEMFEQYGIPFRTELLTGSMKAKERREAYERIETGESQIIIGTHALIQEKVNYRNLGLVITDEQHRFGVRQREALAKKGNMPHILVMSATPIPRTLAIIIYGDLDLSVIDELPKDRLPIKNCVVDTGYRETAYRFMKKQVEEGRQCYVICPMVEESEAMEAENVIDYSTMLSERMGPEVTVGYLHGKMKQTQKDEIMEKFAQNQIQILVSTTVVEVGINVPNATVMMVENAERFGLAQLHQLRGRVGRGAFQSYCIFMTASRAKETKKRLDILNHSNDGFYIAGEDLKLRGPGDLFGIRQSGLMEFKLGDIFQDAGILQMAAEAASSEEIREFPVYGRADRDNIHVL
ncbi:ATP-dependent DNA helicase RecG [Drancourtella massiliensis]|uniref:ATP-dependent DNA helicase RecG n=1 Tax=Drancourtella massiliensis TaxID=1632013 RepID=A0ABS2EFZ2_9FIRM|nr:ATP-dependent DNA helicase RecG [Drancourtella massiliensis]MBM6743791.1 ATP-dependent DNA helicase RecG [Drancourtella massiliensis]